MEVLSDDESDESLKRFVRWLHWIQDVQDADRASKPSTSTSSGPWSLVARTRSHHAYADNYTFPSNLKGWAWIRKRASNRSTAPRLLSLDCEMVETDLGKAALVGFCLVDGDGKVVLKSLVKPRGSVLNYRTELTGLTEKDLAHVSMTREEARKQVKAIMQEDGGSIICGHAVYNDLKALRTHHHDVIDTALVFQYKDLPLCSPSLKDLAKLFLGLEIRTGEGSHHDSYEDAFVTMKLIQHEFCQSSKGPTPLLTPPDIKVSKEDLARLFVHRLPLNGLKEPDLLAIFRHCPFVSIDGDLKTSPKVYLVFKSPEDANAGFKGLNGTDHHQTDNLGRAQKEVSLGLNKNFLVRKMAGHNGRLFGRDRTGMREMQTKLGKPGAKKSQQAPAGRSRMIAAKRTKRAVDGKVKLKRKRPTTKPKVKKSENEDEKGAKKRKLAV